MADTVHGFLLVEEREIPGIDAQARRYRHEKSGADLISIRNSDPNKVFGISFRTPPEDSSGVAHILEHSVLCGSERFPVKEPFVELLKGSLQTFLNAFTYPDKTCYPVASQVTQDLYNLAEVYLDAVFHPLITPEIFQQEGWHYELENMDGPLTCKGVVYNEMRGVYSSPDSLLHEYSQQLIFPDSVYGLDSGGDPKKITGLSYQQFRDFHRRYYHPSNARIWFYGDHPEEERLAFLDRHLQRFERQPVPDGVALQPQRALCRTEVRRCAAGQGEDGGGTRVTVNWLLPETADAERTLGLIVLENALLGMSSSPLRKKLIDSGLGEKICGIGLETELRQMYFSTGLQGVAREQAPEVEALILETLEEIAESGLEEEVVAAACNTVEFSLRENNTGSFPRGLALMLASLTTWLYDEDPFLMLEFEQPLRRVVEQALAGKGYLEGLIREFLTANRHRVTLILEPDPGYEEELRREAEAGFAATLQQMSDLEKQSVMETASRLLERQEAPDPEEALRTIPVLKPEDLDRQSRRIRETVAVAEGVRYHLHPQPTNGVAYFDIGFDLSGVAPHLRPWLRLFGRALLELGTAKESGVSLTRRISRTTGGIGARTVITPTEDPARPTGAWFFLRGKVMADRAQELFAVLEDVLLTPKLDERERFMQLLQEERARLEQRLVPGGHQVTMRRVQAMLHPAARLTEELEGISWLEFLRRQEARAGSDWSAVQSELEQLLRELVVRRGVEINITAEEERLDALRGQAEQLAARLPLPQHDLYGFPDTVLDPVPEFWTAPAQVNFVAKGARLFAPGTTPDGALGVVARFLKTGWLWDRIRVVGGAYGAFCSLSRLSGTMVFASYRDPNLAETLEVYDKTAEFLRGFTPGQDVVEKAILGRIGDLDSYELPDAKGFHALMDRLRGTTPEQEQLQRDQIFAVTAADFQRFGELLASFSSSGAVSILGSARQAEDAQRAVAGLTVRPLL